MSYDYTTDISFSTTHSELFGALGHDHSQFKSYLPPRYTIAQSDPLPFAAESDPAMSPCTSKRRRMSTDSVSEPSSSATPYSSYNDVGALLLPPQRHSPSTPRWNIHSATTSEPVAITATAPFAPRSTRVGPCYADLGTRSGTPQRCPRDRVTWTRPQMYSTRRCCCLPTRIPLWTIYILRCSRRMRKACFRAFCILPRSFPRNRRFIPPCIPASGVWGMIRMSPIWGRFCAR
jgi:hypothetical protein